MFRLLVAATVTPGQARAAAAAEVALAAQDKLPEPTGGWEAHFRRERDASAIKKAKQAKQAARPRPGSTAAAAAEPEGACAEARAGARAGSQGSAGTVCDGDSSGCGVKWHVALGPSLLSYQTATQTPGYTVYIFLQCGAHPPGSTSFKDTAKELGTLTVDVRSQLAWEGVGEHKPSGVFSRFRQLAHTRITPCGPAVRVGSQRNRVDRRNLPCVIVTHSNGP